MLPEAHRLKQRSQFKKTLSDGVLVGQSPVLLVLRLPGPCPEGGLPLGVIVSKKVSKRAVDRNRLRRQLAVLSRLWLQQSLAPPWVAETQAVVMVVRQAALGASFSDFKKAFESCFSLDAPLSL